MIIDMALPTFSTMREVISNEASEQGDFSTDMASLLALMPATSQAASDTSGRPFTEDQDNDTAIIHIPVSSIELLAPTLPLQVTPDFLSATETGIAIQQDAIDNERLITLFDAASRVPKDTASIDSQVKEALSVVRQERDNRLNLMLDKQRSDVSVNDKQPLNLADSEFEEISAQFSVAEGADESVVSRDMPILERAALLPGNIDAGTTRALSTPESTVTLPQMVGTLEWQKSLGQQIALFSRDGIQHAELRLHPEELGAVQVSMRMSNERMQIHFIADNLLARDALENSLPSLRQSLAESGIHLGQSSVGADTNAPSSNASYGEKRADTQERHREDDGSAIYDDKEEQHTATSLVHYRSGINTFV